MNTRLTQPLFFPCTHKSGMVVHEFPAGMLLSEVVAARSACQERLAPGELCDPPRVCGYPVVVREDMPAAEPIKLGKGWNIK
jgi:hypothetical protein